MKAKGNCPFCNENEIRILSASKTPDLKGLIPGSQVECVNCAARGPCGYATDEGAILAYEAGCKPLDKPTSTEIE